MRARPAFNARSAERLADPAAALLCAAVAAAAAWFFRGPFIPSSYDDIGAMKATAVLARDVTLIGDDWYLLWGKTPIPLLWGPYVGSWDILATVPFLALFPDPVDALWARSLFFGAWGAAAAFFLLRRVYGDRLVALLGALLMASLPGYAAYTADGLHACIILVPLAAAGLDSLWAWLDGGRGTRLLASGALLGLGLASHAHFLALMPAAGWILWLRRADLRARLRNPLQRRWAAAALAAAFLALLPMLWANLEHDWVTLRFFLDHLAAGNRLATPWGESPGNLDYTTNLRVRLAQVGVLLSGQGGIHAFLPTVNSFPSLNRRLVLPGVPLVAAALAALFYNARQLRPGGDAATRRGALARGGAGAAALLVSPFSPASLALFHLTPILPLGLGPVAALCRAPRTRGAAALALAACVAFNLASVRRAAGLLQLTGTIASSGPAVLELRDWLLATGRRDTLLIADTNIFPKLVYLSGGRLRLPWRPNERALLRAEFRNSHGRLVVASGDYRPALRPHLEAAAGEEGLRLIPEKTFLKPNGAAAFTVYRLARR